MPVKTLSAVLGLIALIVASTFSAMNYFQSQAAALDQHSLLAEYDERGKLENELEVTTLEIRYLVRLADMGELTVSDEERLIYLRQKRNRIESRLQELNAGG